MRKIIFFTALLFTYLLFLPACLFGGGGGFGNDLIVSTSETESDRTRDRRSVSGNELCRDDNNCEDICEDVYDDASDEENDGKVETCQELRYRIAIQFEDIMEALEEPYESNLRNIDHKAFSEFLDVSLEPWIRSTRSVSNSEAEALLVWVARERKISDAIDEAYQNYEREYDKFEGVANLFEEIASEFTGCSGEVQKCVEMFNAITETAIVGSHTSFWNIVQENVSLSATAISCEVFDQRCEDVQSSEAAGCGVDITDYENFSTLCGL